MQAGKQPMPGQSQHQPQYQQQHESKKPSTAQAIMEDQKKKE
jgi:hypothetical protein